MGCRRLPMCHSCRVWISPAPVRLVWWAEPVVICERDKTQCMDTLLLTLIQYISAKFYMPFVMELEILEITGNHPWVEAEGHPEKRGCCGLSSFPKGPVTMAFTFYSLCLGPMRSLLGVRVDETTPDRGTPWWDGSWIVLKEVTQRLGAYCSNSKT